MFDEVISNLFAGCPLKSLPEIPKGIVHHVKLYMDVNQHNDCLADRLDIWLAFALESCHV